MNMAVNEPGRQYQALQVNGIAGATAIEACDPAFMDGHVRSMHLAGEKVGKRSEVALSKEKEKSLDRLDRPAAPYTEPAGSWVISVVNCTTQTLWRARFPSLH